ncbi:MAG: biopolymer transporter Tol [Bacteroidota bacterium]
MLKRLIILSIVFSTNLYSQFNEYEPEYNWLTIKGKHVYVHYHEEAERTARVVAKIADEVWEPITSLYQYQPETVHYVIKDIDDYSNGATYFFDNKIEIWASALDFDLRGAHNWLRNVISHEFTHLVQIQAALKLNRSLPAFYFQFLNYEDKRRQDILYGFPNVIVSYPIAALNMPAWFAEGTAQYMRKEFDYDNWDTHRDMILRSYVLDGNMLTWNQMGVFGKTSLGNESVYNSGFALTSYIAQTYGEDKLREVSERLGNLTTFTIDAAFEHVLGIDGKQLYNEWKFYLTEDYNERVENVKKNLVTGALIQNEGFGNFYPVFSNDGEKFYYISNKKSDYFGPSAIYEYNIKTKEEKKLVAGVNSSIGVIPNDDKIVYAKLSEENPKWTKIHDLYMYDISEDEDTRITFGLRANNPAVSNDGKKIIFLFQKDGTTNLGIVDIDGKNFKKLTFFENGEQVYNPKFSSDDSKIVFDYSYHQGRDIAIVKCDGSNLEFILQNGFDERNAQFINDDEIIYSSDETGIFNLYRHNLISGKKEKLTNVLGGAFLPAIDSNGQIVYSGYTSTGYKIFSLSSEQSVAVDSEKNYLQSTKTSSEGSRVKGDLTSSNIDYLKNFNDYNLPEYEPKKYSSFFSRMSFFPFIRWDNYVTSNKGIDKIKPGVYFTSSDYLNRYSLFGGISINKKLERDAYLNFEYREKLPLIYNLGLTPVLALELFSVSRQTDVDIFFDKYVDSLGVTRYDYIIPTDVTYNLFEVDVSARHKIFAEGNELEFRFMYSKYSATLGSFIVPNLEMLYPTTDDTYFVGRNVQLKFSHKIYEPNIDTDINPVGRDIEFVYSYEFNKFNSEGEYEIENGLLIPQYTNFNFHRVEFNWKEFISVYKGHTLNAQFRAASILGPTVPDFFDFYLGGLIGMKSYPFYSISGNELGWLNLSYRFPLFKNLDMRIAHLYLDKIFLSIYGDIGNTWNGKFPETTDFKKGAGAEIRMKMNSFYLFPTSLFFNAAYSFDKFERQVREEKVVYGKEWSFYGGVLFDFSF